MKYLALLLVLVLAAFSTPREVHAQVNSVSGGFSGLDHINRIIQGTPGISTVSVTGGVNAVASGAVNVNTPGGLSIPVPTSVTAKAGTAAVALGAARIALRVLPWVGTAIALNDIATTAAKEGWKVCPPPAFFCIPDWDNPDKLFYWMVSSYPSGARPTALESAVVTAQLWSPSQGPFTAHACTPNSYDGAGKVVSAYCAATNKDGVRLSSTGGVYQRMNCNTGVGANNPPLSGCGVDKAPKPDIAATESTLQASLDKQYATDQAMIKKMYDTQKALDQANPSLPKIIPPASLALTITAPPVTSSPVVVAQDTYPNADGNGTSTKKVTQQTVVTPTLLPGATAATANPVTYPISTTSTTTVTNNVTNVTNTTSTTIVKADPVPQEAPEKLPTDYNREATQQEVLKELKAADMVTDGSNVDDKKPITDVGAADQANKVAIDGISSESIGLRGWLPNIPVAECVNPQVQDHAGNTHSVPICGAVNTFKSFISAVICVFALYGCVREVQAAARA